MVRGGGSGWLTQWEWRSGRAIEGMLHVGTTSDRDLLCEAPVAPNLPPDAKLFASQNHWCAAVLSALTDAHSHHGHDDFRNCGIGAWLLSCAANGEADGAD
jgi:hypothetical protein